MIKFESQYFDDVDDLVNEKDTLLRLSKDDRDKVQKVRNFTNGLPLMSEEEAEEEGRTEITNHMLGYRNINQIETQNYSIYSSSNGLAEVKVDTDSPEIDAKLSTIITMAVNRVLYDKGKFGVMWRSVSGELPIASVAPLMFSPRQGWCPRLAMNMLFPKGTGYIAEDVTYAFAPRELTVADLKRLSAAAKSGNFINKDDIDSMLDILREQIRLDSKSVTSIDGEADEIGSSVDEKEFYKKERKTTLNAWMYYEVVHTEEDSYVSASLFTEGCQIGKTRLDSKVISFEKKAYKSPDSWLHFMIADSEIGGTKTIDTAKGIARLTFNSDNDREELLNTVIEGTKERARPKFKVLESADIDAVLAWNPAEDPFAPSGVEEFRVQAPVGDLFAPFEILGQNSAGISSGAYSNQGRGGETRNQTLERQRNVGAVTNNRISDVYKNLDMLLDQIVTRLLTLDFRRGTEGWQDIAWLRYYLDREIKEKLGLPWEKLTEKKFGRFLYLKVRAIRTIGEGNREEQLAIADWLMDRIGNYQPQVRPHILHRSTQAVTKDPDLADFLVRQPDFVLNSQRVVAENEYDTILRRAVLGELIPTSVDDVHQDHLATHLKDLSAHLARNSVQPWTQADMLGFAGMVEHIGEHLQVLLGNKATIEEAKVFTKQLQEVVQAAQAVVKEVQAREGNEQNQLTDKERMELELKFNDQQLRARKLGLDAVNLEELIKARNARQSIIARNQYSREIGEARRLDLQEEQIKLQKDSTQQQ